MHRWSMALLLLMLFLTTLLSAACGGGTARKERDMFVRVSPRDPRYFELDDGRPFIPIGLNIATSWGGRLDTTLGWIRKLGAHGGNFCRLWISQPLLDVEHARSGAYDAQKAERIEALLAAAREHGVRVKMCIEHFRAIDPERSRQRWALKAIHHVSEGGPYRGCGEFFDSERGRAQFKAKLAWFRERFGDEPTIFGWELWNEMNCVRGGDWIAWTEAMLAELHRLFPRNLAMQSLGSFDRQGARGYYRRVVTLKTNDVAQIHRYLDLGARLEVCHGPVDVLAADAIGELRSYEPGKPMLLAESGAVEPRHTGPFKLYPRDTAGIILHDVVFAPFFAGAAGTGHCWHWGNYVDKLDLWHHFARFAAAAEGLDPPAEGFEPVTIPHERLRVYALKGRRTFLAWCRDSQNTWMTELKESKAPETLRDATLVLGDHAAAYADTEARCYDPWSDKWTQAELSDGGIALPAFSRSLVVRIGPPPPRAR
ncbi:MAG: hypothetical protein ACODAJ_10870 [Planctomycetota bacterium]